VVAVPKVLCNWKRRAYKDTHRECCKRITMQIESFIQGLVASWELL
jgi:hypothetical protein